MSFKILGIGDPHLHTEEEVDEEFQQNIQQLVKARDIDRIVTVGDVIDPLPDSRTSPDVKLGNSFFRALNSAGVPVDAIPGNHDYDIHEQITQKHDNVNNLAYDSVQAEHDGITYTIVGRGATQFDQGPEINLDNIHNGISPQAEYSAEETLQELEADLDFITGDASYTELEEYFDVKDRADFRDQIDNYREEYAAVEELLEEAEGDTLVYMDHNLPFNTNVDINLHNHHSGSLVNKQVINEYGPELFVGGHLHDGGVDYVSSSQGDTTIVNLGEKQVSEMSIEQGNANYTPITEPRV